MIFWSQVFFSFILIFAASFLIVLTVLIIAARFYFKKKRSSFQKQNFSVGFFHPYCNAGAGGERVLWCAVVAVHKQYPSIKIIIYTGDLDASPSAIVKRTEQRFNLKVPENVEFIYLHKRKWVESKMYPVFTILGQSVGSIILGIEAITAFLPDVYIDTMGYAFTMPLFSYIGGCKVATYTHYPIITTEMLSRVSRRVLSYNNDSTIARSSILSSVKIIYYRIFSWLYSFAGKFADVIMVNSSWTENHINSLWGCPLKTFRVYPPCDTEDLTKISLERDLSRINIISIGQFRPEKDHVLQLKIMYELRQIIPAEKWDNTKLIIIGSTRNNDDETYVKNIQDLCKHLSLENNVEFKKNISYEQLKKEYKEGLIGLHTMWNEHFGIGVVECMAAGLIMIAHNSGGPKMDIIETASQSRNGYLATTEEEFAKCIASVILCDDFDHILNLQRKARTSVDRFSTKKFNEAFLNSVNFLFTKKAL